MLENCGSGNIILLIIYYRYRDSFNVFVTVETRHEAVFSFLSMYRVRCLDCSELFAMVSCLNSSMTPVFVTS